MIGDVHGLIRPVLDARLPARFAIMLLAVLPACASAPETRRSESSALSVGDPNAAPNLQALPEMAEGAPCNTARTHQALLMARQTFDTAFPAAPVDHSYTSLQAWVDSTVTTWVSQRRAQTDATRDRFSLEGEPSDAERIVSHAVIGLIDEDTARALATIPAPSELDSEPEIADMYREMVSKQAAPFVNAALAELRDCANDGYRGPEEMRSWARFCHARFDRLSEQAAAQSQASSKVASKAQ
jgi:hypothetical protein